MRAVRLLVQTNRHWLARPLARAPGKGRDPALRLTRDAGALGLGAGLGEVER